tara:strand:+ start:26840 stop:28114 length:1275 start_codon:yes stop_codon:yes gene_type:complete
MIEKKQIEEFNLNKINHHKDGYNFLSKILRKKEINIDNIINKLSKLEIAIPSWALGIGGTRFGRFSLGGQPRNLNEKIHDVGILNTLTKSSGLISLHIPWDIPDDFELINKIAKSQGINFDSVNSNTFQDQKDSKLSYKFGSLSHVDKNVRDLAISHNIQVINYGKKIGAKSLTVWLADGSSYPGQSNFRDAFKRTLDSLHKIYEYLPDDWKLLIEYKPHEPYFYSMVIPDWGSSFLFTSKLGKKAYSLIDLGHHLPNTNIEQIVAILMQEEKLGGFHFNDSNYGDDDLTVGSQNPFQLFLIFCELVQGEKETKNPKVSWMIDASHNLKDPLEDLLQSIENIKIAYIKSLLVDFRRLREAQEKNDITLCESILNEAFNIDVRPIVNESNFRLGGSISPIDTYRKLEIRKKLTNQRGQKYTSSGL